MSGEAVAHKMDTNHAEAEENEVWSITVVSVLCRGAVQESACHKCLLLGATDKNRKTDILCGNKSLFMPSAFKQTCICREAKRKADLR